MIKELRGITHVAPKPGILLFLDYGDFYVYDFILLSYINVQNIHTAATL